MSPRFRRVRPGQGKPLGAGRVEQLEQPALEPREIEPERPPIELLAELERREVGQPRDEHVADHAGLLPDR